MSENPELANCIGHTLVTTDGTTLLGADDKSGVAAIMKMAEVMMNDNSILHGDVRIGFTPDEEIGQGTKFFNIKKFGCKYAYTIDGEMPGELNKETFSANGGVIRIKGRDIHPGSAKNIMVNATRVAGELISRFPRNMAPETTEGHEPYIHPHSVEGGIGEAVIKILFRDFRTEGLAVQKEILEKIIAEVQAMYPKAEIILEVKEQYRKILKFSIISGKRLFVLAQIHTGNQFVVVLTVHVLPKWVYLLQIYTMVVRISIARQNGSA